MPCVSPVPPKLVCHCRERERGRGKGRVRVGGGAHRCTADSLLCFQLKQQPPCGRAVARLIHLVGAARACVKVGECQSAAVVCVMCMYFWVSVKCPVGSMLWEELTVLTCSISASQTNPDMKDSPLHLLVTTLLNSLSQNEDQDPKSFFLIRYTLL